MNEFKLYIYNKNVIILSQNNGYDGYNNLKHIHGICLYNKFCPEDIGKYYKDWDITLFKEINSVDLNNLSNSKVRFYKTKSGHIVIGGYLISSSEIVRLDEFLYVCGINIRYLGLTKINKLKLRKNT